MYSQKGWPDTGARTKLPARRPDQTRNTRSCPNSRFKRYDENLKIASQGSRWLIHSPSSAILNELTLSCIDKGVDVAGLGQIALSSAPVFGGALLGVAAGQFRSPDYRGLIKQDMDLLDRLPPEAISRRADLQRTIDARIDDLIDGSDRNRALRKAAASYQGNWRDVVLVLCVLLFTFIWWGVDDHRGSNWLVTFILLILLSIVTAAYAIRGILRSASSFVRRQPGGDRQDRATGQDRPK